MIRAINISINKLLFERWKINSDTVGAFASALCMIHCLATPIFFIASACSSSCCNASPLWWQWMDYVFLGISFVAIRTASKSSTKQWVIQGLWINWATLFFLIVNAKLGWFQLAQNIKFIPAFALVFLHTYNMKFCKCEKECC